MAESLAAVGAKRAGEAPDESDAEEFEIEIDDVDAQQLADASGAEELTFEVDDDEAGSEEELEAEAELSFRNSEVALDTTPPPVPVEAEPELELVDEPGDGGTDAFSPGSAAPAASEELEFEIDVDESEGELAGAGEEAAEAPRRSRRPRRPWSPRRRAVPRRPLRRCWKVWQRPSCSSARACSTRRRPSVTSSSTWLRAIRRCCFASARSPRPGPRPSGPPPRRRRAASSPPSTRTAPVRWPCRCAAAPPKPLRPPEAPPEPVREPLAAAAPAPAAPLPAPAPEPRAAAAEPAAESGDFDLAAELSEDEHAPVAGLGASSGTEEEGFLQVFAAFKAGVEKQLGAQDFEARFDLGIAYKEMGLFDDALGEFRVALEGPNHKLTCLHMMGLCALDLGRSADAVAHLEQALALPDLPADQQMALRFDLGRAYEAEGDAPGRARRGRPSPRSTRGSATSATTSPPSTPSPRKRSEADAEEAFESFDDLMSEGLADGADAKPAKGAPRRAATSPSRT